MWSLFKFLAIGLCVEHVVLQSVVGEDCQFSWPNGTEFLIDPSGVKLSKIQDIAQPGKELLTLQVVVKSIKTITSDSISNDLYMEPILDNNTLTLKLTDHFVDYEEIEFDISMSISVTFECSIGVKKVEFIQPIEDTNNHWPEFQKTPYIYKLPMPFPKGVSLNYFAPISARDIDLTNRNITFHLDSADPNVSGFSVSWLSIDRKLHNATLVTKTVINFLEDVTFTLYATDTGVPANTRSTIVTIQVDRESSILRFAKPLYIADLTNLKPEEMSRASGIMATVAMDSWQLETLAKGKIISFGEGDVGLGSGADNTVTYKIQEDVTGYSKSFDLIATNNNSKVQLRLIDPPEKFFDETFVLLTLTAEKSAAQESTVLHISLPGLRTMLKVAGKANNIGYVSSISVLVILLIASTAGLTVMVIKNHRIRRKSSSATKLGINNDQNIVPEMTEVIRNGSVSPSGSFGKSMAFNDTVEEIKIAKL